MNGMSTRTMIERVANEGGGTFYLIGGTLGDSEWVTAGESTGFYVGIKGGVENIPDFALTEEFVERVAWTRHRLSGYALGLWRDDRGNWSIDEVTWFGPDQEGEALDFGEVNNQRAIWDIQQSREVLV